MSYYSLNDNEPCGMESIIRSRGMISLAELACLRKSVPASVEEQLHPLVHRGCVECLKPVSSDTHTAPGQIYYRWRDPADTRHAWQIRLLQKNWKSTSFQHGSNQMLTMDR